MVTTNGPKYPDIEVTLTGEDGNAFNLIGIVKRALDRAAVDRAEIETFVSEAMSGDYDNLLATCMRWVEVS